MEGVKTGYLPGQGRTNVTMQRSKLLHDAKQDVIKLADNYEQLTPSEKIMVPGVGGKMAMHSAIDGFLLTNKISEHDALIAKKLAHVICGGDMPTQGFVSEQHLLDIEREAFISLCGEEKSQARMQSLLMTGKPLRN
jgi:3-hydroxyacyl-CoA dehydrogenase